MSRGKVRVAIIGVGNCASSLVQGVHFYRGTKEDENVPGLMHVSLGGYHVSDLEFVAAFDVSAAKVGLDLAEAICAEPNYTYRFADVPASGVRVSRGPTYDGLGKVLSETIAESGDPAADVAKILRLSRADVAVCYLPVGSEKAVRWYAEQALEAGCGFVNCVPVFIASRPEWRQRFEERGLPLVGDDIKSQVGATITHRVLTNLFQDRGVRLDRTVQFNLGGDADFMSTLERERLESTPVSGSQAVAGQLGASLAADNVPVGPGDRMPWLQDRKRCCIHMEGTTFGNMPLRCEVRLEVWDSPNSAGVVIDAVRCAKLALDRGIGGALVGPSGYFMKSPPVEFTDYEARLRTKDFIEDEDALRAEFLRSTEALAAGGPVAADASGTAGGAGAGMTVARFDP